jgi:hypothetical protein
MEPERGPEVKLADQPRGKRTIKKRFENLEVNYAGKSLPDFDKMTPEQCEAWIMQGNL